MEPETPEMIGLESDILNSLPPPNMPTGPIEGALTSSAPPPLVPTPSPTPSLSTPTLSFSPRTSFPAVSGTQVPKKVKLCLLNHITLSPSLILTITCTSTGDQSGIMQGSDDRRSTVECQTAKGTPWLSALNPIAPLFMVREGTNFVWSQYIQFTHQSSFLSKQKKSAGLFILHFTVTDNNVEIAKLCSEPINITRISKKQPATAAAGANGRFPSGPAIFDNLSDAFLATEFKRNYEAMKNLTVEEM